MGYSIIMVSLSPLHLTRALLTIRILKIALLAAIGTAVAGSAQISSALTDPSDMSTVITLRKASAILSFGASIPFRCNRTEAD